MAAIGRNAGVFDGKTSGAGRCKRVHNAVKQRHAASEQKTDHDDGERHINRVKQARRVAHGGRKLANGRPGAFCAQQMERFPVSLGHGDDCKKENQHAHAADPVRKGTPVKKAVGQPFNLRKDGGASRGETGHGFKPAIDKTGNCTAQVKRKRAEQGKCNPTKRGDYESFARMDAFAKA